MPYDSSKILNPYKRSHNLFVGLDKSLVIHVAYEKLLINAKVNINMFLYLDTKMKIDDVLSDTKLSPRAFFYKYSSSNPIKFIYQFISGYISSYAMVTAMLCEAKAYRNWLSIKCATYSDRNGVKWTEVGKSVLRGIASIALAAVALIPFAISETINFALSPRQTAARYKRNYGAIGAIVATGIAIAAVGILTAGIVPVIVAGVGLISKGAGAFLAAKLGMAAASSSGFGAAMAKVGATVGKVFGSASGLFSSMVSGISAVVGSVATLGMTSKKILDINSERKKLAEGAEAEVAVEAEAMPVSENLVSDREQVSRSRSGTASSAGEMVSVTVGEYEAVADERRSLLERFSYVKNFVTTGMQNPPDDSGYDPSAYDEDAENNFLTEAEDLIIKHEADGQDHLTDSWVAERQQQRGATTDDDTLRSPGEQGLWRGGCEALAEVVQTAPAVAAANAAGAPGSGGLDDGGQRPVSPVGS